MLYVISLQLDLNKSAQKLSLSLEKAGIQKPPEIDLAFVLDVSYSFHDEHEDGITNDLVTRLVPWGMVFDPDKKLDVFTFSSGRRGSHYVGDINTKNYRNYVQNKIVGKVPGWNGGTDYSYVIEDALRHFGWLPNIPEQNQSGGFLGSLFGKKKQPETIVPTENKPQGQKSLVIFVTDGDNSDKSRTMDVLRESQSRGDEVYFLFIGVSNQGGKFPFLKKIGDEFDNTGEVIIANIRQWVKKSDEEINRELIGDELIQWLKK